MSKKQPKKKPEEKSTLRISHELKERLRQKGEMGESYENVIRKLLDKIEKVEKRQ